MDHPAPPVKSPRPGRGPALRPGSVLPPRPPRPAVAAAEPAPPVYQWRYQAGKNGHLSKWMDVDENAGVIVHPGDNRITSVAFRVKPEREVCESELRATGPDGAHYHRCIRDLEHGAELKHLTKVGGYAVEWA